jgi:hypothetical protein
VGAHRGRHVRQHPYVLIAEANLATALDDADQARLIHKRVRGAFHDRYGPDHPLTKVAGTNGERPVTLDVEPIPA